MALKNKPSKDSPTLFLGALPLGGMQFSATPKGEGEESEESNEITFLAIPHGEWNHPWYGDVKFNESKTKRIAENFTNNVRGTDVPIRYEPHFGGGKAAGWVKKAESKKDGLHLTVEYTPAAKQAIKDKEYRYFSAEIAQIWEHPQTEEEYQDVLIGGVICCDPFLKRAAGKSQVEVAFADYRGEIEGTDSDEENMGLISAIKSALKLSDDTPDEKVEEVFAEKLTALTATPPAPADTPPAEDTTPPANEGDNQVQSFTNDELRAQVIALTAQINQQNKVLADIQKDAADKAQADKRTLALAAVDAQIGRKLEPAVKEDKEGYEFLVNMAMNNITGFNAMCEKMQDLPGIRPVGMGHTPDAEKTQGFTNTDRMVAEAEARRTGKTVDQVLESYKKARDLDHRSVVSLGN